MTLDISADFGVVDNLETVTFYSRVSDANEGEGEEVENVLRRVLVRGGEGMTTTAELVFHVWSDNIASGTVPKARDTIKDSNNRRYTVLRVETQSLQTRYRLFCVRVRS